MNKDQFRHALMAIFVGACVAFLSSLFQGLAAFLQAHAGQIAAGGATALAYMTKEYRV